MASSDDKSVRILSECSITPSHPTPANRRVMFLAAPDILFRFVPYYLRVLFYKLPADVPFASVMAQIKQGLANVLVDFYPVSGRLFEQPTGRLALHCNDAGVPFLEASCNFSFSALQADRFQYKPFFTQLAPHADVANWTGPDLPLFSVQDCNLFLGLTRIWRKKTAVLEETNRMYAELALTGRDEEIRPGNRSFAEEWIRELEGELVNYQKVLGEAQVLLVRVQAQIDLIMVE